jgi:2-polyprenyl-3-methyl-5-hydroxy-6-metoxy-1,4-benzoquinol methylase
MSGHEIASLMQRLDVEGVVKRSPIHEKDNMRSADRDEHYFSVGKDALRNVLMSMVESKIYTARRILDFPSGYGRAARWLRAAFPEAEIHVGDVWADAVKWTASQFRADIIEGNADFSARFGVQYDVIFCGSLLTHLPGPLALKLLDFLAAHLTVGGIALVSASGRKNLAWDKSHFNAKVFETPERLAELTRDYDEGRYAFAPYPGEKYYGRSFTPVSWFHRYVVNRPNLIMTRFCERSWDDNQDMLTLKRIA